MKIAMYVNKGGCGKSTLTAHVGFQAMERNMTATIIDADESHNVMSWLSGHSWDGSDEYQQGTVTVTANPNASGNGLTVIDAPPPMDFVRNVKGVDVWCIPVAGRFSVQGAMNVIEIVGKSARVVLVMNMVNAGTTFGRSEIEEIKKVGAELFAIPIQRNDCVRRAEMTGQASWSVPYGSRASAAQNLRAFADWVLSGCSTRGVYTGKSI